MASSTAIIRLKRKRNEDPLPTLYLGVESSATRAPQHDTIKRPKVEHTYPSIFTLALTVDSDEYTNLEKIQVQEIHKPSVESRPLSSDSDCSNTSKKRAFSDALVDQPKFRMSRKKPRQQIPDSNISQDYIVFDAVREPVVQNADGVPEILPSGIPDEIQSGDPTKDAALYDMLKSFLTTDRDNRTYVNLKDEYVYDIYYQTAMSPSSVPADSNFGVLVYDSEPELMDDDEEVVDDDDVDSNSEGYYQNSYPDEDEWAGEGWGSEEEDEYGGLRTKKLGFDSDEDIGLESGEDLYSYSETE